MNICIDLGFGHIKYAFKNGDKVKYGKIPSKVSISNKKYNRMYEYGSKGNKEFVGVGGTISTALADEVDLLDFNCLTKYAPLFLYQVLEENNIDIKDVDNVLYCLAPAFQSRFDDFKESVKECVVNGKSISIPNIEITKQGECALEFLKRNISDMDVDSSMMLIVDVGFNTLDVALANCGEIEADFSEEHSEEKWGFVRVANMVKKELMIKEPSITDDMVTIKEVLDIIWNKEYKLRGVVIDLSREVDKAIDNYTKTLNSKLEADHKRLLDKCDCVAFIGGGSFYINTEKYPSFIKFANGDLANVLGGLIEIEKKYPSSPKSKK